MVMHDCPGVKMRIVIVSREAPDADGILASVVGEARAKAYAAACNRDQDAARKMAVYAICVAVPAAAPFSQQLHTALSKVAVSTVSPGQSYLQGFRDGTANAAAPNLPEIPAAGRSIRLMKARPVDDLGGGSGIVITPSSPRGGLDGLLFGRVNASEQLQGVLDADGGNSAIHVFSQKRARELFRRQGGGIIEDGAYCLHPKRERVLVPMLGYHQELLAEMQREARVTMGRLGAKRLVIETVQGATFGGGVVSRIPLKSGGVEFHGASKEERVVTYEWGSPTYEPQTALAECALLQDNSGVMTIVDQRRTSNLTRFEEFSRVDTQFGVGLDLMGLFKAGFSWSAESTYRYSVEFFDRPAAGR